MKNKSIIVGLMALVATLFCSCDRSGRFEFLEREIPWNFCVAEVSDENMTQPVEGATVKIYRTESDRDEDRNVFLTKNSDSKGEALFTFDEFNKGGEGAEALKGWYYITVTKDSKTAKAVTYYLLMNSGTTYQWIELK